MRILQMMMAALAIFASAFSDARASVLEFTVAGTFLTPFFGTGEMVVSDTVVNGQRQILSVSGSINGESILGLDTSLLEPNELDTIPPFVSEPFQIGIGTQDFFYTIGFNPVAGAIETGQAPRGSTGATELVAGSVFSISAVPEPLSLTLFGQSLIAVVAIRRMTNRCAPRDDDEIGSSIGRRRRRRPLC